MLEFIKDNRPETKLIFMDWLEDNDLDKWEAYGSTTTLKSKDFCSFGNNKGKGEGRGNTCGVCNGSKCGNGVGRGKSVFGSGDGYGSSHGIGAWGFNIGHPTQQGVLYMEIGKAYLVHCGDWHTFVGRIVKMISPVVYLMQNVSKISNTNNGDNWHNLANNIDRDKATYLHYEGIVTIPLTIVAFEWVGKTPKEAT